VCKSKEVVSSGLLFNNKFKESSYAAVRFALKALKG